MLSVSIVHITDLFTTLILWAGLDAPKDRDIDGTDQRAFLGENKRPQNREGFLNGIGNTLRSQVA
jgi:arylsulfatase